MANNVDLMVVGAVDGISATELTERLTKSFGQPAEAFTALLAAACEGGPHYAAQTAVTLDTAVEGQEQLEQLGIVCQLLIDGEPLSSDGVGGKSANDSDVEIAQAESVSLDADPETEDETNPESEEDIAFTPDADDQTESDFESLEFADDESEANEPEIAQIVEPEPEPSKETAAVEVKLEDEEVGAGLPVQNGLEIIEVNFDDDLDNLDAAALAAAEAAKQPVVEESPIDEVDSELEVQAADDSDISLIDDAESLELSVDSEDKSDTALTTEDAPAADISEASVAAEEPLELSLSLDDSAPLTTPKKKSGTVPDDGGLTLALDDAAPIEPQVTQTRDTSREHKEDPLPIETAEPVEPEQPEPEKEQAQPQTEPENIAAATNNVSKDVADNVASDTVELSADAVESAPASEASEDTAPDVSSFINSLVEDNAGGNVNAGGLVLPGQESSAPQPITNSPAEDEVNESGTAVSVEPSDALTAPTVVDLATQPDAELYAPEVSESGGLTEEFIKRRKRRSLAAAVAGVGAIGVGALVVLKTGVIQLPGQAQAPVVVAVAPAPVVAGVDAELEAVEEGSLNAALERTSAIKNPDKYSTEELIMYLSSNLGEGARDELKNYVAGDAEYTLTSDSPVPRMGAAIPADSDSELWLINRVDHPADKYFDEWSKREVDLQAYLELQERLIEGGDLDIALDVSKGTKDKLFSVMSQQRLARAYHAVGNEDKATEVLALAVRGTYAIDDESERVLAIADFALSEKALGLTEDAADSFLKASILARSLAEPESRTIGFSAIAQHFHKANRSREATEYLELAMITAHELPVNTAARDLAIRHVALTEVRLGLTDLATEHAALIVDPFAAVSALHGIALQLEKNGDEEKARMTLNMAYRAGSLIRNSEKREKLLEKIQLSGN